MSTPIKKIPLSHIEDVNLNTEIPNWDNNSTPYSNKFIVAHNGGIWRGEIDSNNEEPTQCENTVPLYEELTPFTVDRNIVNTNGSEQYDFSNKILYNGVVIEYWTGGSSDPVGIAVSVGDIVSYTLAGGFAVIGRVLLEITGTETFSEIQNNHLDVEYITIPFNNEMLTEIPCDSMLLNAFSNQIGLDVPFIKSTETTIEKVIDCVLDCPWTLLAQVNESSGGGTTVDYIPLTGTEEGKPITGRIQITNPEITTFYSGIDLFGEGEDKSFGSGTVLSLNPQVGFMLSTAIRAEGYGSLALTLGAPDGPGFLVTGLTFEPEGESAKDKRLIYSHNSLNGVNGIIVQDSLDNQGLVGQDYYGANYDDNTYVQKKYVDEAIAGAGGGATGDYIPLTGTEVGKPVTGPIEILAGTSLDFLGSRDDIVKLKRDGRSLVIANGDDQLEFLINGSDISIKSNIENSPKFVFGIENKIMLYGSEDCIGIELDSYYGANYTDNTYVQKKYVDDFYKSISGYNAGANQTLKNISGVLTWVTD